MTAAELLAKCRSRGIRLQPLDGGQLDVDGPEELLTADLLEALRRCKAELLRLLAGDAAEWLERIGDNGRRIWQRPEMAALEVIDWPDPCPVCGGIVWWQDLVDGWHCEACSPRTAGPRLRDIARRLRTQYGLT